MLLRDRLTPGEVPPVQPAGVPVSIVDLVVDRPGMRFFDVIFDQPLGETRVGEVLGRDPATVKPKITGSWRWFGANVLRFEAPQRLTMATEYEVVLRPDRLLEGDQYFAGKTALSFLTDRFQVERVDVYQEPAAEEGKVVLRGDLRFNYPVDPNVLATRIRLVDPLLGEEKPVPVHFEIRHWSPTVGFRTDPVEKRKEERSLTLTIFSDLTSVQGNVSLPADHVQTIPLGSSERLTVRGAAATPGTPESMLRIRLSAPVDPRVAGPYVTVEPAVKHRLSVERDELVLTGPFEPGSSYKVVLAEGLPARDGSVLKEPFERTIPLDDLPPSVDFQSQGMFLSASGARTLALESVNVDEVRLTVDRVYRNNVFYLFEMQGYALARERFYNDRLQHALGDRLATETLKIRSERNRETTTPIALDRFVKGKEPGLYRIGVTRSADSWGSQRWVLVTDVGIVARQADDELLVWISSFASLAPIANAEVRLVSDQNQTIATGRTDANGFWRLDGLAARLGRQPARGDGEEESSGQEPEPRLRPAMILVEAGDDFSFLPFESARVDTGGLDVGGDTLAPKGYAAYLYGERDLYRPGEIVEGVAVVRDGALEPPPPMPARLRHRDPEGRLRGTQRVESDANGLASFTLELPPYARTGHHTLELLVAEEVIGRYRFQVEEFVPDRIRVEITAPKAAFTAGEEIDWEVASQYLFGAPAAGLAAEGRVRLVNAEFTPKGYDGFVFRNGERSFDEREIAATKEALDAEGKQRFTAAIPPGLEPPASLEAVLTARVQEQGGRGVAARERLRVHPWAHYVGLRRSGEGYAEPRQPVDVEWVLVSPEGKPADGGKLRADFYRDRWQTVLRRTASGNFRYESIRDAELLESREVDAAGGRGTLRFTPQQFGAHRVVVTDLATGASSQLEVYASGWGYSPWAIKDPSRIELELDRDEYAPGETATLQVRAPFSGKLLLTIERDRIHRTEVHDLAGNTATISLPIERGFRPNVYVTATLVRKAADLEPGGAGRAFGAVPLFVDRETNRLEVKVGAPAEIRPKTSLAVDVTTAPGATLTVAAVDEGILQLVAQKTPDPFSFFYRKLALSVQGFDIHALLLPELKPVEGAAPAGGGEALGDLSQFVRTEGIRRPEPAAFWSGVLRADADGKARAEFDLPRFQGALRLMAVAHRGSRFGAAERATRVKDPIVLLPTFPRILSFGEEAEIPVTVRNDTGKDGTFTVRLESSGPVSIAGEATRAVEIAAGREAAFRFGLRTGEAPGEARLVFAAEGNGETTDAEGVVALRPDLPPQTVETAGTLAQATTVFPLADAERFRPETLRREIRIAPTPLLELSAQLRMLLTYPYGCTEQVVSGVFPLIYLSDLAKELEPKLFAERGDPAVLVQEAIRRVATTQLETGGFSLWPNSHELHPWTSIYTTHFLVEARRAGYTVEAFVHDRALEWLTAEARAKERYGRDELERVVYALYVLARADRAAAGTMDFVREKHVKELRPDSRALLAATYAQTGDRDALDPLLAGIEDAEAIERQTGYNFASTIRNRALLLLAFLDAAPDDPRVTTLARRLARDAETPGWTTQESAFALLALGQLFHRQAAKGPYAGKVFLGERELGAFTSAKAAVFGDLAGTEPLRVLLDEPYEPGAAFFALRARGIPTDEAFRPEAKGLEIERVHLTRDGAPLDLASVSQGDLVVARVRVRSVSGRLENVVVENLLASGLEVENPRLESSESLPWIRDANLPIAHLDLRDDRVLVFADLPDAAWKTYYALLRAVTPGRFRLPPVQAEAMYDPSIRVTGERGSVGVVTRP